MKLMGNFVFRKNPLCSNAVVLRISILAHVEFLIINGLRPLVAELSENAFLCKTLKV